MKNNKKIFLISLFVIISISLVYIYFNVFKNGYHIETYKDGSKYEGNFKDGKKHGIGRYTYTNGSYVGEFKDDKMHGNGTFRTYDGLKAIKYVGEFKDDKMHGNGTYTIGDVFNSSSISKYVGEFKDDMPDGKATFTTLDGIYVGEFKNGTFNGHGTYTFVDGRKYVGDWKDGKFIKKKSY